MSRASNPFPSLTVFGLWTWLADLNSYIIGFKNSEAIPPPPWRDQLPVYWDLARLPGEVFPRDNGGSDTVN